MVCVNLSSSFTSENQIVAVIFGQLRTAAPVWIKIRETLNSAKADAVSALWKTDSQPCKCFQHILRPKAAVWLEQRSSAALLKQWHIRQPMPVPMDTSLFMYHTIYYGLRLVPHFYRTVMVMRSDVIYELPIPIPLPYSDSDNVIVLGGRNQFMRSNDYSNYTLCGSNPFDIMFFGTPKALSAVQNLILHMDDVLRYMREQPGYMPVNMKRLNWHPPNTFLGNNEAILGHRLRMMNIKCPVASFKARVVPSTQSRWHHRNQIVFNASHCLE